MGPFNRAEKKRSSLNSCTLKERLNIISQDQQAQKNNCIKLLKPTLPKVCHIYKLKGKP